MFVSVSMVRMPPMNWGGDSDFFYRTTYGPQLKNTDGLRRALYGPVARLTEERPRFSHAIVLFWESREAWEKARKRIGGTPPLPRAFQGLETYAGDLSATPADGPLTEQGTLGVWLSSLAADAAEPGGDAAAVPGLRRRLSGAAEVAETSEGAPRSRIALLDFESHDAALNALRTGLGSGTRRLDWAADLEAIFFDVQELVRK